MRQYYSLLKKISLFQGLSDEHLDLIFRDFNTHVSSGHKGHNLFLRRNNYETLYVLIKGSVKIETIGANAKTIQIREISAPEIIAPFFLFGSDNFLPINIIAKQDIKMLKIPKKDILKLFQNDMQILERFLKMISDGIILLSSKMTFLHFNTIKKKLAYYLLELKKNRFGTVVMNHSIIELSEYFGVEHPSLSKVIGQFTKEGIIERQGRKIIKILNRKKLDEILSE